MCEKQKMGHGRSFPKTHTEYKITECKPKWHTPWFTISSCDRHLLNYSSEKTFNKIMADATAAASAVATGAHTLGDLSPVSALCFYSAHVFLLTYSAQEEMMRVDETVRLSVFTCKHDTPIKRGINTVKPLYTH